MPDDHLTTSDNLTDSGTDRWAPGCDCCKTEPPPPPPEDCTYKIYVAVQKCDAPCSWMSCFVPYAGCTVTVVKSGGGTWTASTSAGGGCVFSDLCPGTYDVTVSCPHGASRSETVTFPGVGSSAKTASVFMNFITKIFVNSSVYLCPGETGTVRVDVPPYGSADVPVPRPPGAGSVSIPVTQDILPHTTITATATFRSRTTPPVTWDTGTANGAGCPTLFLGGFLACVTARVGGCGGLPLEGAQVLMKAPAGGSGVTGPDGTVRISLNPCLLPGERAYFTATKAPRFDPGEGDAFDVSPAILAPAGDYACLTCWTLKVNGWTSDYACADPLKKTLHWTDPGGSVELVYDEARYAWLACGQRDHDCTARLTHPTPYTNLCVDALSQTKQVNVLYVFTACGARVYVANCAGTYDNNRGARASSCDELMTYVAALPLYGGNVLSLSVANALWNRCPGTYPPLGMECPPTFIYTGTASSWCYEWRPGDDWRLRCKGFPANGPGAVVTITE